MNVPLEPRSPATMSDSRARLALATLVAAVFLLPLAGALLAGRSLGEFFQFPPPLEIPTGYLRFSWPAAAAVLVLLLAIGLPWLRREKSHAPLPSSRPPVSVTGHAFPRWGLAAIVWTLVWWTLAWTRWEWFAPLQRYTFLPLWLGFIVSVNALTHARTGSCLMLRAPRRWLTLFAASAACWWAFEWLNRFVRNWHYLNVEDFGATAYALHATVCFSTVLPAVAAVAEWLHPHPRWLARTASGPVWRGFDRRATAAVLIIFGVVSLVGTGAWPSWFYPALWVSPLALFLAASIRSGPAGLPGELARGDWRRAATWMIAALVCGFFWEMWNWHSVAKWIYTVPGVERWHLFEMPALGYAGYLPFGLECLLVTEWVIGRAWQSSAPTDPSPPL